MKAFLAGFADRLNAIGRTNDLLTRYAWTATDLSALLELELGPFGEHVTIRGPALKMSANCAVSLAMIVHELATNAMKYGALSGEGRVDVSWRTQDGGQAILTWIETGGPPVERPATEPASGGGFGSRLIARLAEQQLHGAARLDLRPEGLRAEIDFLASAAP
jgi:two-component sensor histidine kinase